MDIQFHPLRWCADLRALCVLCGQPNNKQIFPGESWGGEVEHLMKNGPGAARTPQNQNSKGILK
jgi:hypothetical protein